MSAIADVLDEETVRQLLELLALLQRVEQRLREIAARYGEEL